MQISEFGSPQPNHEEQRTIKRRLLDADKRQMTNNMLNKFYDSGLEDFENPMSDSDNEESPLRIKPQRSKMEEFRVKRSLKLPLASKVLAAESHSSIEERKSDLSKERP